MTLQLTNWRQVTWPADVVPWPGFDVMAPLPVPAAASRQPRLLSDDALAPWERHQLVDALAAGAAPVRAITGLRDLLTRVDEIYADMMDVAEYVLGARIEAWDLVDDAAAAPAAPAYVLWLYGIDCGVIFEAQGLTRVGEVVQAALWCAHPALQRALADAQPSIRAEAPTSQFARMTRIAPGGAREG